MKNKIITNNALYLWGLTLILIGGLLSSIPVAFAKKSLKPAVDEKAPFVYSWHVSRKAMRMGDTMENIEVALPLRLGSHHNFTVDWGDGTDIQKITTYPDRNHTYSKAGTYTVTIRGSLGSWTACSTLYNASILTVESLGKMGWYSLKNAFRGCNRLHSFNAGNTDTSHVTSMEECLNLQTSGITSIYLRWIPLALKR